MSAEKNLGASIRARLLNRAKSEGLEFNRLLTRFALERILYRISISEHADRFMLKGALLFDLWFDVPHRPTRDIDLLGFWPADLDALEAAFRDLCAIDSQDGIRFDPESVKANEIRKEANYGGIRVTLIGRIDGARCSVQVDIGFGDAVVPAPEDVVYPVFFDHLPAPKLRAYPRYTVVAEKFQALTALGIANSRMKDYFDLWVLAEHARFDGAVLSEAIAATFARRGTTLPRATPLGLTEEFAHDAQKQVQWQAFLRRNQLGEVEFGKVVARLEGFLMPPATAVAHGDLWRGEWRAGEDWR